jgi:hypothetical protein
MSSTAGAPVEAVTADGGRRLSADDRAARYRYGAVLILLLTIVVFVIIAGDGTGSRAVAFALSGTALMVAVGTSRERSAIRRRRVAWGTAGVTLITLGIATGVVGASASFLIGAVVTVAVPVSLSRGLLRLVGERGATTQAVAGAIAIYLSIGLTFAFVISFIAAVGPAHYFAQSTSGSASDRLYFSFTVLTTTGFGDFTAAHGAGRALAVIEMLTGQLYLVTVIGILIGRRVERAR